MFKYTTIKEFLTKEHCDMLLKNIKSNAELQPGRIGIDSQIDKTKRDSNILFFELKSFPQIKEELQLVLSEKIKMKGYELDFENQQIQFTEYQKDGHYIWHEDGAPNAFSERYCSLVIQLNNEYEGGELQLKEYDMEGNETIITFDKGVGNLFVFLSSTTHRVAPIIDGNRYSLVSWFKLRPIQNFKKTLI
jgi:predicted 2-oxoglutarate/Fe(II)-dependent dioxygenase YbiX